MRETRWFCNTLIVVLFVSNLLFYGFLHNAQSTFSIPIALFSIVLIVGFIYFTYRRKVRYKYRNKKIS